MVTPERKGLKILAAILSQLAVKRLRKFIIGEMVKYCRS